MFAVRLLAVTPPSATLSVFIHKPSFRKLSSISRFFSAGQSGWKA